MPRKAILALIGIWVCTSFSLAQATSAPPNAHQTHDQKARLCRKAAAEKQLRGEELRAFVANCMAPAKASGL
jgi:hypothetical protein